MHNLQARVLINGSRTVEFIGPADITEQHTDAIVNAANSYLMGGGGVDGAIHDAGGPSILEECQLYVNTHGQLPAGGAILTTAGQLTAKFVIHCVGPRYGVESNASQLLASCYQQATRLAELHNLKTMAFPSISTGAYGYPIREAAEIAVHAVTQALEDTTSLKCVRFVLFDVRTTNAYIAAADKLARSQAQYGFERSST